MSDINVEEVILPELSSSSEDGSANSIIPSDRRLDIVGDVKVSLDVHVGRVSISLSDLFAIKDQSVLKLDTAVSEPVSICLDGRLVAQGIIVVVGDNFGIKVTDVLFN